MNNSKPLTVFSYQLTQVVFFAFFCLTAFGQLQRFEWGSIPAFYLHEVVLVGYCLWHIKNLSWWKDIFGKLKTLPIVFWLLIGWIVLGEAVSVLNGASVLYPTLYVSRIGLYAISSFCLWQDVKKNKQIKTAVWIGLLNFFGFVIYFGLLQFIFLPDTRFLFFLGWDDHYARLLSTLFDPGFTGLICGLAGLVAVERLVSWQSIQRHKQLRTFSLLLLLFTSSLACLLTYSRATFLTYLFSCGLVGIWFWQKEKRLTVLSGLVGLVFLGAIFVLPRPGGEGVKLERTSTITSRTSLAADVLGTLQTPTDWFIGRGVFQPVSAAESIYSETTSHGKQPDNWLVLMLSGVGVVGSILVFANIWLLARRKFFSRGLIGVGLLAVAVHGLFNASFTYPFVLLVLGTWTALTLGSSRSSSAR